MNASLADLLRHALDLRRTGRRAVACVVVGSRGSTPQSAGAVMLVDEDAGTIGTIGGGCVEAEVRQRAVRLLHDGATGLLSFQLDHDYGWDDGLICGGTLELAVADLPDEMTLHAILDQLDSGEPASITFTVNTDDGHRAYTVDLPPRERLYIAGAGHVGQALARLASRLEFEVTLFDDRAALLAPLADDDVAAVDGDIASALREAPIDARTSCVIVTRGHRHDEQALEAVVGRGARYVGMIGSRRKVKLIFDDLTERGVDPADLEAVRAPIGLDIGSVTVEEIAVSIAAELVSYRRQHQPPARVTVPADHRDRAAAARQWGAATRP